jgi:hypothetical protein
MIRRRTVLIAAVAILIAGGTTLGLALSSGAAPAGQTLAYNTVPGQCRLLTASALAAYLPDALTDPPAEQAGDRPAADCSWTSISDHQDRELEVGVALYEGPTGVTDARHRFQQVVAASGTSDDGISAVTKPLDGLGNQAAAIYRNFHGADPHMLQFVIVEFQSSNALVTVSYWDTPIAGDNSAVSATTENLAGLSDQVALARDVLTVLAHPATAGAATVIAATSGPRYGVPPHACRLVPMAMVERYLPGALGAQPPDTPSMGVSNCNWDALNYSSDISLMVSVYGAADGPIGPQVGYETDVQEQDSGGGGTTLLNIRPVTGVGGQATAIYTADPGTYQQGIALVVWSGNAVVQLTYQANTNTELGPPPPSRSAQLAAAIEIARTAIAALPRAS